MPISQSDLDTLKEKVAKLSDDYVAAKEASVFRAAASHEADVADATFHQAVLDETSADAVVEADVTDFQAFVDGLSKPAV